MNINSTMGIGFKASAQPQKVTKLFVPAKEGTLRCEIGEQLDNRITVIKYDLLKKGKVVESKAFKDKDGLNKETITVIYQKIQQNILDGFDFLDELIKAQSKKNRV